MPLRKILQSVLFLILILSSCKYQIHVNRSSFKPQEIEGDQLSRREVYKVHLKDGKLVVLKSFMVDENKQELSGIGAVYLPSRELLGSKNSSVVIPFEDCVLVETNYYKNNNSGSPIFMVLATLGTTLPAIICLTDPKACFGSCPTFYLHQNDSLVLYAEGFSSSITKTMEEADLDNLTEIEVKAAEKVRLDMRNEAFETHYVRSADLIVVAKPSAGEVYKSINDRFYQVDNLAFPISSGTLTDKALEVFKANDNKEYISAASPTDLTEQEEHIFEFDGSYNSIVVNHRQSLMSTFLMYQSMAYMGEQTGHYMAQYERLSATVEFAPPDIYDVLGGVEVLINDGYGWVEIGTIEERGPIARDAHLIKIPERYGDVDQVKLRMTKGLWKIDYVAMGNVTKELEPILVQPEVAYSRGEKDAYALNQLLNDDERLVTNPGSVYTLEYSFPEPGPYQLFLRSEGFYVEWMREEWLEEEDQELVKLMINDPKAYLKILTPKYKEVEYKMEELFWSSKFQNAEL